MYGCGVYDGSNGFDCGNETGVGVGAEIDAATGTGLNVYVDGNAVCEP